MGLKGLSQQLNEIHSYLDKVASGQLPVNHQIIYLLQVRPLYHCCFCLVISPCLATSIIVLKLLHLVTSFVRVFFIPPPPVGWDLQQFEELWMICRLYTVKLVNVSWQCLWTLPLTFLRHFYRNVTTLCLGLCCRKSVCCLSVTLVHPTLGIETLGNISLLLCTLANLWPPCKILRRSSQGTPLSGALNARQVAKYRVFHKKTTSFDFVLYLCQIVLNFYKSYPLCTLGTVLSSAIKNFHTYNIYFASNYLISSQNTVTVFTILSTVFNY